MRRIFCFVLWGCLSHSVLPAINPGEIEDSYPVSKRVLVLKGDGMYTLALADILDRMEKATGKQTAESYDMIIGNGMGGVLALYLAQGKSAEEFKRELYQLKSYFYGRPWWKKMLGIQRFDTAKYEKGLRKLLGENATMKQLLVPTTVMVRDEKYEELLLVDQKSEADLPLWKAARATASYTFYDPFRITLKGIQRRIMNHVGQRFDLALATYLMDQGMLSKQGKDSFDHVQILRLDTGSYHSIHSIEGILDRKLKDYTDDVNLRMDIRPHVSFKGDGEAFRTEMSLALDTTIKKNADKLKKLVKTISSENVRPIQMASLEFFDDSSSSDIGSRQIASFRSVDTLISDEDSIQVSSLGSFDDSLTPEVGSIEMVSLPSFGSLSSIEESWNGEGKSIRRISFDSLDEVKQN